MSLLFGQSEFPCSSYRRDIESALPLPQLLTNQLDLRPVTLQRIMAPGVGLHVAVADGIYN
jgi:hypothetical protein